ncbi:MAG: hypothetical protein ACR5K7_00385 [Symbiopectobacterium sp.]
MARIKLVPTLITRLNQADKPDAYLIIGASEPFSNTLKILRRRC